MTRPFAADDFAAIRARLTELERERHGNNDDRPAAPDLHTANQSEGRVAAGGTGTTARSEPLPMQRMLLKRLKVGTA